MSLCEGVQFGRQVTDEKAFSQVAAPLPPTPAPSSAVAGAQQTASAAPSGIPAPPPAPPAPAPSSAPAAAAQSAPAAPAASVAGAELDCNGLPWDARIHGKSADGGKPKNADGSWRQRRNLLPDVKTTVEVELRALVALNAGATPASNVPPPPPGVVAPPAPPAPPPASAVNPLGPLLAKIAPHFASGKLTPQQADAVAVKHGLQNLSQLVLTPNLVPAVEADLDALIAAAV